MKYWIVYWGDDVEGIITNSRTAKKLKVAIEKYGLYDILMIEETRGINATEIDQLITDYSS